jgi:hypothetical protein
MTRRHTTSGPTRLLTATAAASALVTAVGLTAGPASSAPATDCPAAYPLADLAVGDPVTGSTVTGGTTPTGFGGEVLGVLESGIAPGVDMVLVDLDSPTIDRVGIWQGMSGSPVYASDGRLVGAVSYSLGVGPSTVAGVTPAAEMHRLLAAGAVPLPRASARVRLPRGLSARVVRSGAASTAQATLGMRHLRVPVSLSGVSSSRLVSLSRVLGLGALQPAGAAAGATSSEAIEVVTGGNLAASLSYGTLTAAAVGTATMVCGTEVVGFGHPMTFAGKTTMSLHGARAVLVQNDPTLSGFKVANIGAPVGTVDADRVAGLHAVTGPVPDGGLVRSRATDAGRTFAGTTRVTVPEVMPELAFTSMLASQDRVLDRQGEGTAWAQWTVRGLRKNGTPFRFTRRGLYADPGDVSSAPAIALAEDLMAIADNPGEVVRITSVRTESRPGGSYETYSIRKVQARMFGSWIPVTRRAPVPLRAGTVARLKVFLTSREGAPRTVVVRVRVPVHAAGRMGTLNVSGGNNDFLYSDDFYEMEGEAFDLEEYEDYEDYDSDTEAPTPATFPRVLREMAAEPQRNQVVATLHFGRAPGKARRPRVGEFTFDRVVDGSRTVRVVALP